MGKEKKNKIVLLVALMVMLYFTSYMTRLNFSAAKAILIEQHIFTKPQTGIIGACLFFAYGAGQIISGFLSDKYDPVKIISAGLILTCICNFIIPFFSQIWLISIIWGLNGFAQALFWPPIVRILDKYTDKAGYTKGIWCVSIAAYTATILIYFAVPLEVGWFDWTAAFRASSLLALIVLVVWIIGYRKFSRTATPAAHEEPKVTEEKSAVRTDRAGIIRTILVSGTVFVMIAVAMQGFMKDGIQDWLPTLFSQSFESVDAKTATFSNVILPIFSILTMSLGTVLLEKVFKDEVKEAIFFFVLSTVLCVILMFFYKNSAILMLFLCALISSCMHCINAMFTCFAPRRFQKEGRVATMSGVLNSCSYLGSAISSYAIGNIAEKHGWSATLNVWTIVCLIGLAVCVVAYRPWKKFISAKQ